MSWSNTYRDHFYPCATYQTSFSCVLCLSCLSNAQKKGSPLLANTNYIFSALLARHLCLWDVKHMLWICGLQYKTCPFLTCWERQGHGYVSILTWYQFGDIVVYQDNGYIIINIHRYKGSVPLISKGSNLLSKNKLQFESAYSLRALPWSWRLELHDCS